LSLGRQDFIGMTTFEKIQKFPDKYRTALAFMADPVAVLDRKRRVLYFNPAFERQFQTPAAQGLGRSLEELLSKTLTEKINDQLGFLEKEPSSRNFVITDGSRDFRATISPILFNNRQAGSILMMVDISSERATRELNKKIISTLMDDIQLPLNELSMCFSQYPEETVKESDYREKGEKSFRDLVEDFNDLNDFCSLILEEEVIQRSTFSPQKILNLALRSLRPRAREKGVFLEELSQEEIPDVVGDQARLSRIIILVCDYFLRQIPEGEIICLSAELKRSQTGYNLLYSTTATGIVRTKMEEGSRFETESNDTRLRHESKIASRRLFLMQRLVLAMKGSWATAAQEGLGTTLTVSIPTDIARS
jgi:PAS domain S-box-containing protein